eukprot:m.134134 g.134134  ORF g.134134 m.134134 type:complete len:382 (+) comp16908_c0_seq6:275-1420(+)
MNATMTEQSADSAVAMQGYLIKAPSAVKSLDGLNLSVSQWRKRWFVLFVGGPGAVLEYWQDESQRVLKGTVKLTKHDSLRLNVKSAKFNYTFSVVTPSREYFLAAKDAVDFMHWVTTLGTLLLGGDADGTPVPSSILVGAGQAVELPPEEETEAAAEAEVTAPDEEGGDDAASADFAGFEIADPDAEQAAAEAVVADTKALKHQTSRQRLETFLAVATQSLKEFSGKGEQYIDEHNGFSLDIPTEFALYASGKTTMWIGPQLDGVTTSIYVNTMPFEDIAPEELQAQYEEQRKSDPAYSTVERCTVDRGFEVVPALRVEATPTENDGDYQRSCMFVFGNSKVYTIATIASTASMRHPHLQQVYAQVLNSVELVPLVAQPDT